MASILTNQNICYSIKDKKSLIEVEKALYTLFYRVSEMMGTPSIPEDSCQKVKEHSSECSFIF